MARKYDYSGVIKWWWRVYEWEKRVRRDIINLERAVHRAERRIGLKPTKFKKGDPGAPPPPPWQV